MSTEIAAHRLFKFVRGCSAAIWVDLYEQFLDEIVLLSSWRSKGVRGGSPERRRGGADLMQQLENLRAVLGGLMADTACHVLLSEMATLCHNKADQLGEFYDGLDPIVARWRNRASILDQAARMVSEGKFRD
jgi:hypothetical protein